jgi:triosephosphate isomerase
MLIAGNWKMNTDLGGAVRLAEELVDLVKETGEVRVAVCPPFISLGSVSNVIAGSGIALGAQNLHYEDDGAYTGEISARMLLSVGCRYVIIGHSERRQYFSETDETVNRRVRKAMDAGLIPIVCVGETLDERDAGRENEVVGRQIDRGLNGIDVSDADRLVVAYEPVWAIGTGRNATPEQAQQMHAFIRTRLRALYGAAIADDVNILYGGSMKPSNSGELLAQQDVDGGLIGGASLKAADFAGIIASAPALVRR